MSRPRNNRIRLSQQIAAGLLKERAHLTGNIAETSSTHSWENLRYQRSVDEIKKIDVWLEKLLAGILPEEARHP